MKKYELTNETIEHYGVTLYRIIALKNFGNVKICEFGGYVESENNLSQDGDCWIYDNAKVYGNARVYDSAEIYENTEIYGNARVFDSAEIYGDTYISAEAIIHGEAIIHDSAGIYGNAEIYGNATIYGDTSVYGDAVIHGNAEIYGEVSVYGNAEISGNAKVCSNSDYIVFKNNWSSYKYFTWTKSNNMWHVGCFCDSGEELIKKAYKDSQLSGDRYKLYVELVEKLNSL